MAKKETIKLFDFITEAIKAGNWDIDIPEEETYFTYECPDGKRYDESTKFSPETGEPIFKRKSDGQHFYYCSYDGRIEENYLEPTEKIVVESWDFEKYFM
jgi:hypothetical protein